MDDLDVIEASLPSTIIKIRTNCSGSGCNVSDEVSFSWNVLPLPNAIVSSDQQICIGESTQIFAVGGVEYTWFPEQTLDFEFISNPTATPVETTIYTVDVVGSNGCEVYETVTIQVNQAPLLSAGIDVALCLGETGILVATGADSFVWNPTFGLSDPFVPNPSVDISFNITYTVSGTDSTGCMATDYVTVSINDPPVADAGEDIEGCLGDSYQLQASGGATFDWTPITGLSSSNISNPITTLAETIEYHLLVTDGNGCTASDELVISVNPIPSPSIIGVESVCSNEYWTRYNTAEGPSFYNWYISGGEIMSGQGTNEIFVHWLNPGDGSVSVNEQFISNGCSNESFLNIDIGTDAAPDTVQLELLGNSILTCPNCLFTEYIWGYETVNNGQLFTACEGSQYCQFAQFNTNDYYFWLMHGNGNGCLTKSYYNSPPPIVQVTERIEKPHLNVFPNPANTFLNVGISVWTDDKIQVGVFDINNHLVLSKSITKRDSFLQISHLPSGVYFLRVELHNAVTFVRFIKS